MWRRYSFTNGSNVYCVVTTPDDTRRASDAVCRSIVVRFAVSPASRLFKGKFERNRRIRLRLNGTTAARILEEQMFRQPAQWQRGDSARLISEGNGLGRRAQRLLRVTVVQALAIAACARFSRIQFLPAKRLAPEIENSRHGHRDYGMANPTEASRDARVEAGGTQSAKGWSGNASTV